MRIPTRIITKITMRIPKRFSTRITMRIIIANKNIDLPEQLFPLCLNDVLFFRPLPRPSVHVRVNFLNIIQGSIDKVPTDT